MAAHFDPKTIASVDSRRGKTSRFVGRLRFSGSVRIGGRYEGHIDAGGFLFVEEGAEVKAEVKARTVVIGGTIRGNVEAYEEVEMLPGCAVYGNVRAGRIRIADGVVFEGRCEMLRNAESIDVFSAPLEQLRRQAVPLVTPPAEEGA